jgi:hypothetical protein
MEVDELCRIYEGLTASPEKVLEQVQLGLWTDAERSTRGAPNLEGWGYPCTQIVTIC